MIVKTPCFPARAGLLLVLGLLLAACGPDGPASEPPVAETPGAPRAEAPVTPPPAPEVPRVPARKIEFQDGLAAGAKAADSPDDLLFVYIGRYRPT